MSIKRADDLLVAGALAACAGLCLAFRYLPMSDLPQHYAMVSILLHRTDPGWGFAERYTTDFLHRPYATVYWLGWTLASVMPLGAAMRIIVALCTVAPFAGAHTLLVATRRPRVWLLPAIPFAFGSLWHWGFLNFLFGTGMFLGGLALVVVAAERRSRVACAALGALSVLLLLTHFHGLVMLLTFAPVMAWGYGDHQDRRAAFVRSLAPLAPAALGGAAFVLVTWAQAKGNWPQMNPGLVERITRFPEFLDAGLPDPWPLLSLAAFAIVAAAGAFIGRTRARSRRATIALGVALAGQVVLYFALPLNTSTATYVSARHALLVVLLIVPLLPAVEGVRGQALRAASTAVAMVGLGAIAWQLVGFDRDARDFDGVLAAMRPARRVAWLVFARGGRFTNPRTFPYLHFGAYYQAEKGGDVARSLATVWNVPIRYRDDYPRYAIRDEVEWAPWLFTPEDARHFDYLLVRGRDTVPVQMGLRKVVTSGTWSLFENPTPTTP